MLNIEAVEKLAKIEGENLISLYLSTDRKKFSPLTIKTKAKDLFKNINLPGKSDIEQKVLKLLDKVSPNTKSVVVFASENFWSVFAFAFTVGDLLTVDRCFNLTPLLRLFSENRSVGVLLLDAERARFLEIFLGDLKDHKHLEDQVVRKQANGGWSKERFERHREEIIKRHLKRVVEFLIKMHKAYKCEYLFLRIDPELEHEFLKLLPKDIKERLKGHIRVDMDASPSEIIEKANALMKEEVRGEEENRVRELFRHLTHGESERVVAGLNDVLDALYNKKISILLVNEGYSEPGTFCTFCGYISLSEEYCPYDQSPNSRVNNIINIVIDQALKQKVEVEIFNDDKTLKDLGNIGAFLKEH